MRTLWLCSGVALFLPGVAVGVIAVAFPEAETFFIEEHEAAHPFDAFPGVEMRDDQADRAAVLGGERDTVVIECEQDIRVLEVGERDVCGVAFFR